MQQLRPGCWLTVREPSAEYEGPTALLGKEWVLTFARDPGAATDGVSGFDVTIYSYIKTIDMVAGVGGAPPFAPCSTVVYKTGP